MAFGPPSVLYHSRPLVPVGNADGVRRFDKSRERSLLTGILPSWHGRSIPETSLRTLRQRPSELVLLCNEGRFVQKIRLPSNAARFLFIETSSHRLGTAYPNTNGGRFAKVAPLNRHPRLASIRLRGFEFGKLRQCVAIVRPIALFYRVQRNLESLCIASCITDTAHCW